MVFHYFDWGCPVDSECCAFPFIYLENYLDPLPFFKIGLFVFFLLNYKSFYIKILDTSLIIYMTCRYFLSFCGLCFHFLNGIICSTKIFNFYIAQFINFFSCRLCFWFYYLRNHCLTKSHED